jgi:hypothetical protein
MTEYSFYIHIGFFVLIGAMHVYFSKKNTKKHEDTMRIIREMIEKK